jgi:hypothetical protein
LAWSSIPSPSFSATCLDQIVANARRNNEHHHVSGMMLFTGARFERPFGDRSWIAGVVIAVLAISGTVAIVAAITPSIASVGAEGGTIVRALSSPPLRREPAPDPDANTGKPTNLRGRTPCAECGVVTSIRRIGRPVISAGQNASRAGDRAAAGSATSGDVPAGARYEVTVRFRDGTAAIFVEDMPRSLPPGGRVIVIGRSGHPAD